MYVCDSCEERSCKDCELGNPCLGCLDYDRTKDDCKSKGGCAPARRPKKEKNEVTKLDT